MISESEGIPDLETVVNRTGLSRWEVIALISGETSPTSAVNISDNLMQSWSSPLLSSAPGVSGDFSRRRGQKTKRRMERSR